MADHPRSFRRNILLRILLFSLPFLFVGQMVALRKARTTLLVTARQNLTSSAIRKAEDLEAGIESIEANLDLLAETEAFRSGDRTQIESLLNTFIADNGAYDIACVELRAPQAETALVNTCNQRGQLRSIIPDPKQIPWLQDGSGAPDDFFVFSTNEVGADQSGDNAAKLAEPNLTGVVLRNPNLVEASERDRAIIQFIVASPIYDENRELSYTLAMEVSLQQLQDATPQSLVGETVVIDHTDTIVTHPDPDQVGKSIYDVGDGAKLVSVIGNVKAGHSDFVHLFRFLPSNGREWLGGYSGVNVPVSPKQSNLWTVLTVTPIEQALYGLREIHQVLLFLNAGFLVAGILLAFYISRSLSLPVERLIRYTQDVDDLSKLPPAPHSSHIWELDYLGTVIERMLRRLGDNTAELHRAWQDAQLANQLKNEFLANTSHELRTPLNGIIGSIHLIRDDLCDSKEEERDFLEQANNAAMHLLSVIEDILNISKIEAGTLDVKIAPVDLRHIIQEVVDMHAAQIQQKDLRVHRPELPKPILIPVDHSRFKQVLLNVLSNAVKFTDSGDITISVATDETIAPSDAHSEGTQSNNLYMPPAPWVKITITDTGIGIDPQHLSKLFKPFVMIDGSHTRPYEGTGLGLAISQNFMRLMQGDITLTSEGLGQGSTVTIVVPRLLKDVAATEAEANATQSTSQMNGRARQHSRSDKSPADSAAVLSPRS